ncbi:MAG: hypothetical protein OEV94_07370 [Deltaproteobacteria bacterium]|nr:hypothetical protein [Deltaproteobacteria bacterium]
MSSEHPQTGTGSLRPGILPSEQRSTGAIIAFIDLLFLLVGCLTLVMFFNQQQTKQVKAQVEETRQKLDIATTQRNLLEKMAKSMDPFMEEFIVLKKEEIARRQLEEGRRKRKAARTVMAVAYQVTPDGNILYEGRLYSLADFKREVVARHRADKWLSFRASVFPDTPFGVVVNIRQEILKDQSEFDTYWDNLANGQKAPRKKPSR